jgi:hypothetical protein
MMEESNDKIKKKKIYIENSTMYCENGYIKMDDQCFSEKSNQESNSSQESNYEETIELNYMIDYPNDNSDFYTKSHVGIYTKKKPTSAKINKKDNSRKNEKILNESKENQELKLEVKDNKNFNDDENHNSKKYSKVNLSFDHQVSHPSHVDKINNVSFNEYQDKVDPQNVKSSPEKKFSNDNLKINFVGLLDRVSDRHYYTCNQCKNSVWVYIWFPVVHPCLKCRDKII